MENKTQKPKWENVTSYTQRLKVPGGWLYKVDEELLNGGPKCPALCFVPEQEGVIIVEDHNRNLEQSSTAFNR